MKYHPISEIWPLMEGEVFEKLKADIKANGLIYPVTTYKGQVLDGRNRHRACEAVGVLVQTTDVGDITEEQALDKAISLNDHRRHMSVAERSFAGDKLANIINGHNRHHDKVVGRSRDLPIEKVSIEQASAKLDVSYRSITRARAIRTKGTEADVAEVISGRANLQAKSAEVLARKRKPPSQPRPTNKGNGGHVIALYNGPTLKGMTPQEVDPEFKGTPMEFTIKYGHVHVKNAEQQATMRFDDWVANIRALAKRWRELPELKAVDHNWLRSPGPPAIKKLTEALDCLEPVIAEARALLDRAVVVTAKVKAS